MALMYVNADLIDNLIVTSCNEAGNANLSIRVANKIISCIMYHVFVVLKLSELEVGKLFNIGTFTQIWRKSRLVFGCSPQNLMRVVIVLVVSDSFRF